MFGYVTVFKDELLVREFNEYKAVYCSLCKTMGKEYSRLSRFILSYDCTFYAVLLLALSGKCPGYEKKMCSCNPLKKCSYIKFGEEALSKAAALSVISAYFKVIDNISDTKGIKKFLYKMVKPVFKKWCKRAKLKYPYIFNALADMSREQFKAENSENCHIDLAAEPTANMLKSILSVEGRTEKEKKILSSLGYSLGRWIYLIDAIDDYEDDKNKGNFNPFLKYNGEENLRDYSSQVLNQCLAGAYNSWNLLDVSQYFGIIDNILLKGLAAKQRTVLFSEEKRNGD